MSTHRIVITGAPGTGKTAVVEALTNAGYVCFPEVIREFTQEEVAAKDPEQLASNPIVFANDAMAFNQRLIDGRTKQFKSADFSNHPYNFYDRGLIDVLAYMDFFKQTYPQEFVNVCDAHRYEAVFIMPPWEEIFHSEVGRYESFDEAIALHQSLLTRYEAFGYCPIEVPTDNIENRTDFILNQTQLLL